MFINDIFRVQKDMTVKVEQISYVLFDSQNIQYH